MMTGVFILLSANNDLYLLEKKMYNFEELMSLFFLLLSFVVSRIQ